MNQERKKVKLNKKKNVKKHAKRATYSNEVVKYERILKYGHDRVCVCCGQLFAEIGFVVNPPQCISTIDKDIGLIVVRQIGWIPNLQLCITYSNGLDKGKVPKLLGKRTGFLANSRWVSRIIAAWTSFGFSSHTLYAAEGIKAHNATRHKREHSQRANRYRGWC